MKTFEYFLTLLQKKIFYLCRLVSETNLPYFKRVTFQSAGRLSSLKQKAGYQRLYMYIIYAMNFEQKAWTALIKDD